MPLTQREYDSAQVESELKVQRLFEEWRRAFLKGRLNMEGPMSFDDGTPEGPMSIEVPEEGNVPIS
jgi:hypothetical protein